MSQKRLVFLGLMTAMVVVAALVVGVSSPAAQESSDFSYELTTPVAQRSDGGEMAPTCDTASPTLPVSTTAGQEYAYDCWKDPGTHGSQISFPLNCVDPHVTILVPTGVLVTHTYRTWHNAWHEVALTTFEHFMIDVEGATYQVHRFTKVYLEANTSTVDIQVTAGAFEYTQSLRYEGQPVGTPISNTQSCLGFPTT